MGITNKVGQLVDSVHASAKNASSSILGLSLKIITAFVVGLTLAMIGQELIGYGLVSFVFVMLVSMGAIMKIILPWSIWAVLIFDLICVLVALLLRMYILIAP